MFHASKDSIDISASGSVARSLLKSIMRNKSSKFEFLINLESEFSCKVHHYQFPERVTSLWALVDNHRDASQFTNRDDWFTK